MGTSSSQPLPPQQHFNNNLSHLTTDPYYQSVLRQVYSNNSLAIVDDFPQFRGNFNYNPQRNRHNLEVKKTTPIKNDLYINKNSIKLVNKKIVFQLYQIKNNTTYNLTFKFDCSTPVIFHLYYVATEHLNDQNLISSIEPQIKQPNEFKFEAGQNQEFPLNYFPLNITKYNLTQLTTYDLSNRSFPLIIKMSKQGNNDDRKLMVLYCCFHAIKETQLSCQVIRIKIEKNGKAYLANDVYGTNQNQQEKEDFEEKECAICLTEKIDTMIIPCKHMCLCFKCCEDLRFRTQKCPICRRGIERFIRVERATRKSMKESKKGDDQRFEEQKLEEEGKNFDVKIDIKQQ